MLVFVGILVYKEIKFRTELKKIRGGKVMNEILIFWFRNPWSLMVTMQITVMKIPSQFLDKSSWI